MGKGAPWSWLYEPRGEGWSCHPALGPRAVPGALRRVHGRKNVLHGPAQPGTAPPPHLRCHERGGGVGPRVASHPTPALHVGALAPPPSARAPHADSPAGAGPGSGAERGPPHTPGAERGEPGSRCVGRSRHLGLGRRPARRLFSSYGGCWVSSFAKSGFFSSFWSFPSPPHLLPHPHPTPHIASALWILAVTSSH